MQCVQCAAALSVEPNQIARGEGKFCSYKCKSAFHRGKERTTVDRYVAPSGYVMVRVGIKKWRLEHRVVMEAVLGRSLRNDEHVHHVDRNRTNNDPKNLRVMERSAHLRMHRVA